MWLWMIVCLPVHSQLLAPARGAPSLNDVLCELPHLDLLCCYFASWQCGVDGVIASARLLLLKKKKVFSTASWNCLRHDDVAALHTWWCHSPLFLTTNELPLVAFRQIWSSLSNGRLEKTQGCTKRQWFAFWGGGFRGGQVWGNEMPPCVAANIGHARNRHQLLVLLFLSKSIFFNTALCFTLLFLVVMCFRWAQTVKSHFQAFCVEWPVLWNIFSHWLTVLWFWKAK